MHSARVTKTVPFASSLAREPSLYDDLPFKLPVSRLLQIERRRGFEHGAPVYGFHRQVRLSHRVLSQGFVCTNKTSTVARCNSSLDLLRRPFSTQNGKQRLPSSSTSGPRQPPPLPGARPASAAGPSQRRPPIAPPSSSAIRRPDTEGFDDDDLFATSKKVEKQLENKRIGDLKERIALERFQKEVAYAVRRAGELGLDTHPPDSAQAEVSDALYDTLVRYLAHLNSLFTSVRDALHGFRALVEEQLRIAPLKGRRDHAEQGLMQTQMQVNDLITRVRDRRSRAERHLEEIEKQLADLYEPYIVTVQQELNALDRMWREVAYTIDWQNWRAKQLEEQRHLVVALLQEMKANGAEHHETNIGFGQVAAASAELAHLIRSLLPPSPNVLQSKHLIDLRHKVAYLLPHFSSTEKIANSAHVWRQLNRLHQTHIRLPELVDHEVLIERHKAYTEPMRGTAIEIHNLAIDLKSLSMFQGVDARHRNLCGRLESLAKRLPKSVYMLDSDIDNLLHDGLLLRHLASNADHAPKSYAILLPFVRYRRNMDDLKSLVRTCLSYEDHKEPTFLQTQFWNKLEQFSDLVGLEAREFYRLLNSLIINVVVNRLQQPDADYSAEWLTQENAQLVQQHQIAQALSGFSKRWTPSHPEHTNKHGIINPDTLLGDCNLYSSNNVPVTYIMSQLHAQHAMEELQQCTVVGMQMVFGSNGLQYMLLAKPEKIFIFEGEGALAASYTGEYFRELLEDPNIVKVTHDFDPSRAALAEHSVHPTSVLDISCHTLARRLRASDQRKGGSPIHSISHGWRKIGAKSMLEVLSRLALVPAYNLITFLNAVDPKTLQDLPSKLRQGIVGSRDALARVCAVGDGPLTLGPLIWGEEATTESKGWPFQYVYPTYQERVASRLRPELVDFVRAIARNETNNLALQAKIDIDLTLQELKSEETQDRLAAYYLFTSFGEDLTTIHRLLPIDNPARAILWINKNMHLKLHEQHILQLQEAADRAKMKNSRLSNDIKEKPKTWLQYISNNISKTAKSMIGTTKVTPGTAAETDDASTATGAHAGARMRDDEIRGSFQIRSIDLTARSNAPAGRIKAAREQKSRTQMDAKAKLRYNQVLFHTDFHKTSPSPAARQHLLASRARTSPESKSMNSRYTSTAELDKTKSASSVGSIAEADQKHHIYVNLRSNEEKAFMREVQAATQRYSRPESDTLPDVQSVYDSGTTGIESDTTANVSISMGTKTEHDTVDHSPFTDSSSALSVDQYPNMKRKAEINAANQQYQEAPKNTTKESQSVQNVPPEIQRNTTSEQTQDTTGMLFSKPFFSTTTTIETESTSIPPQRTPAPIGGVKQLNQDEATLTEPTHSTNDKHPGLSEAAPSPSLSLPARTSQSQTKSSTTSLETPEHKKRTKVWELNNLAFRPWTTTAGSKNAHRNGHERGRERSRQRMRARKATGLQYTMGRKR